MEYKGERVTESARKAINKKSDMNKVKYLYPNAAYPWMSGRNIWQLYIYKNQVERKLRPTHNNNIATKESPSPQETAIAR